MSAGVRRGVRLGVQIAGFALGLALLGWCVSLALSEPNRAGLERLRQASWGDVSLLLALSALSLVLNGLIFWATLRPARELSPADVTATNALATFLAYLPFKISLITRALVHNRRDHLPIVTIGAWMAAVAAVLAAVVGPLIVATSWRGRIDGAWAGAGIGGAAACLAGGVLLARMFAGARGQARLQRLAPGPARRLLHARAWEHLHAGFAMLASPRWVGLSAGLRAADVAVQAARFAIAARIIGSPISADEALLFSLAYFVIGVVSPSGMLGVREGGTTLLAKLMAVTASEGYAVIALLVTVSEAVVNLAGAACAIAWLRPDRLMRGIRGRRAGGS